MKEYILNCLLKDEIVVKELLNIDNKVQYNSLTINDLVNLINNIDINNIYNDINKYVFITDGKLNTVLNILLCYSQCIKIININKKNIAIIKWFYMIIKKYYEDNGLEFELLLDIDNDYTKYDCENNIVICGYEEFCLNVGQLFTNKGVEKLIIE